MKSKIDPYKELKRATLPKEEALDNKSDQGQDRANDDGFVIAENKWEMLPAGQDLDCWADLRQQIKAKCARIFRREKIWSEKAIE